jgi:hypothetical protein
MKWKSASLIAIVIGLIVGLVLWLDDSSKQSLPDGTVLVMSGVRIGRTNVYTHGTWRSKILGRFARSSGISIAGFKLERPTKVTFAAPEGSECLTAQLRLLPGSPRQNTLVSPPFYRKFRLLISGDDNFAFVTEFDRFTKLADGLFAYVNPSSFPRDSRRLRFRLEERDTSESRNWREVATFVVKNPKPARIEQWTAERHLRLKLADDLEVEIGELVVRHEPIHPTDIWEYTGLLPVRVIQNGQMRTNWGIHNGPIRDASGNYDHFTFSKVMTNDWMVYHIFRPLDPAKAWRFQVNVALDSDFPATNLFSFTIPRTLTGTIQTNLGGFEVHIGYNNADWLNVELVSKQAETRLTFVKAVDDAGNDLDNWSGSWGQHSFLKSLKSSNPGQVHATVAIHPNYLVGFTLLPRYERTGERLEQSRMRPADTTR